MSEHHPVATQQPPDWADDAATTIIAIAQAGSYTTARKDIAALLRRIGRLGAPPDERRANYASNVIGRISEAVRPR